MGNHLGWRPIEIADIRSDDLDCAVTLPALLLGRQEDLKTDVDPALRWVVAIEQIIELPRVSIRPLHRRILGPPTSVSNVI